MKNIFKYSLFGSLIFLFIGCSNSSLIEMSCREKFRKRNQDISFLKVKTLEASVSLNNEPDQKCIPVHYKKHNLLKNIDDDYRTVCGSNVFKGFYSSNFEMYKESNFMDLQQVIDKNGNAFPLESIPKSVRFKSICEDTYRPDVVRELNTIETKYKVHANPSSRNLKKIYLKDRVYIKKHLTEYLYRIPKTPNF